MTGSVFISYRRDDSSGYARAIYNELRERLGPENTFMDVDAIEPGLDFIKVIEDEVGRCNVLLALIGREWLGALEGANSRILSQNDHVRTEIASALKRDIRVIPVLLGGAIMPASENLPADIIPLTRRNAIEIRHTHFDTDVESLVNVLFKLVNKEHESSVSSLPADQAKNTISKETPEREKNSRKRPWIGRIVTLLFFTTMGFLFFLFIDDLNIYPTNKYRRTVQDGDALVMASAITVLAWLLKEWVTRLSHRHRWLSIILGLLAFAALGFGVGFWLNELRVVGKGALSGALVVWIAGFLITVTVTLWQRKVMKNNGT